MSQFSVENHTRYETKDLTALVQFCIDHAERYSGSPSIPDVFHFFEFKPRPKSRTYSMSNFGKGNKSYTSTYKTLSIQYAKSNRANHGVIWIAAPETWLPKLAQLSMEGQVTNVPADAIQMIADRIKSFWHFRNVEADLPTQLRVTLSLPKKVTPVRTALLKRQKFMNTAGDFVTFGHAVTRVLKNLQSTHGKLITDARAAGVPALLQDVDVDEALRGAITRIAEAEGSLKNTLALMHKKEHQT